MATTTDIDTIPTNNTNSNSTSNSPTAAANITTHPDSLLKDEYGSIDISSMNIWICPELLLENGSKLTDLPVCYKTYGILNNNSRNNVLLICHALTGHSDLNDWWGGLLGDNKPFNTSEYYIICSNLLGSCYGSCGPLSINPLTGRRYGNSFPIVTVRDAVNLHYQLLTKHLMINSIAAVIGGSLGGMLALEWSLIAPELVRTVIVAACNAKQSPWQIALNHVQRQSIISDPNWNSGNYSSDQPPLTGLSIARQLAMISYRSHQVYQNKFHTNNTNNNSTTNNTNTATTTAPVYSVESYLSYQGLKFNNRFDAISYIRLTQMLDSHNIARGRSANNTNNNNTNSTVESILNTIKQPVLILGFNNDILYPIIEQQQLAANIINSELTIINSIEGHDAFLLEQEQVGKAIQLFLNKHRNVMEI